MWSLRTLIHATAAAVLLACASYSAAADPVKIRIAWVVPVASWGSVLLEKKDLMKHLGKSYTVEAIRFQGSTPQITALAAGELDIADLAYSSLGLAIQNAGMKDFRVIADEIQDGVPGYYSNEFFVRNDSAIKTVADLRGKVLASNAPGSAADMGMRAMLRKNGIDERRDLSVVEAPFSSMPAMLLSKKADMITGVLPFSYNPTLRKEGRVLFVQKDAVGPTQLVIWVARDGFLNKNRAAMLDFMEDTLRVVRWYTNPANHAAAVGIIAKLTKSPPSVWQGWLFTKKDYYRDPDMLPNLEALQANMDTQLKFGFLKERIEITKYVDLSFVQEAAKRLK